MAPGQGTDLLEVFKENGDNDTDEEELDPVMQSIVEAYHSAPSRKWKLFLLSTIPKKQFTRERLQSIFNCNRYMIDKSRYIRHQNVIRRERLDKHRLEFFFDF